MTYITKNHKTATILVAVAALASALVAAGTIAAATGRYHSAFAHKKGANGFQNSGVAVPTITTQKQKCESAGGGSNILPSYGLGYHTVTGSPIDTSCTATSTNTIDESGGIVR